MITCKVILDDCNTFILVNALFQKKVVLHYYFFTNTNTCICTTSTIYIYKRGIPLPAFPEICKKAIF